MRGVSMALRAAGAVVRSGGDWDRWDLECRGGILGGARLRLAIEEHGAGRQLIRMRSWPHVSHSAAALGAFVSTLAGLALLSGAGTVAAALGLLAVVLVLRLAFECGAATVTIREALDRASLKDTTGPAATIATQPPRIRIALD